MRKENISNSIQQNAVAAISAAHLLHPANYFGHPHDVLAADEIGNDEKRAILASWASDIFAIESAPALRLYPGAERAVSYDEILEALKALDKSDRPPVKQDTSASLSSYRTGRRKSPAGRLSGLGLCSYWKGGRRRPLFES